MPSDANLNFSALKLAFTYFSVAKLETLFSIMRVDDQALYRGGTTYVPSHF